MGLGRIESSNQAQVQFTQFANTSVIQKGTDKKSDSKKDSLTSSEAAKKQGCCGGIWSKITGFFSSICSWIKNIFTCNYGNKKAEKTSE